MKERKKHISNNLPGNSNPFIVPKGYFDSFAQRVMENVETPVERTVYRKNFRRVLRPVLALVASLVLALLAIYVPRKHFGINIGNIGTVGDINYMDYYFTNDHEVYDALTSKDTVNYDDEVVETYILASVSEIELMELIN